MYVYGIKQSKDTLGLAHTLSIIGVAPIGVNPAADLPED